MNLVIEINSAEESEKELQVNKKAAQKYYKMLSSLKRSLSLSGEISLNNIISFPDVITYHAKNMNKKKAVKVISTLLSEALESLEKSLLSEGRKLYNDLAKRAVIIEKEVSKINARFPHAIKEYRERLEKNISAINNLIESEKIDRNRVELEVAMFAKDSDVQEEVTRIGAHGDNFRKVLSLTGELGKRLDFICQEMQREANTIGQRANDFKISQSVIKIKCEVDRMRQQVQNIL